MSKEIKSGIFKTSDVEELSLLGEYINLSYAEHCEVCPEEYHDACFEDLPDDSKLYGYVMTEEKELREDPEADFVAIESGSAIQVIKSKWTIQVGMPRTFPDLRNRSSDEPGNIEMFSLPPEVLVEELRRRVVDCVPQV